MISTPRLDSLTAAGTDLVFGGIRLADEHMLTLKTRPGAERVEEVFLHPGLTAPDTEAWENEDYWDGWLTGGKLGEGTLCVDVPVEAVRALIVQHGGEHEDQEPPQEGPEKADETETAETTATRALAEWGIAASRDDDAGNTWLFIDRAPTPGDPWEAHSAPYALLSLVGGDGSDPEVTVTRAPQSDDTWAVIVGDGNGRERNLMSRPAEHLTQCIDAVAHWMTSPQPETARPDDEVGAIPLAMLRAEGLTCRSFRDSDGSHVKVTLADGAEIVFTGSSADGNHDISAHHLVSEHGSWEAFDVSGVVQEIYNSAGQRRSYSHDTAALVAAVLERARQYGSN
ncbi:hypothetical protein [Streptomyces sp. NPDC004579]|uniref:hypothetical protein n=1 Tax=Streptomyces sp. NPDC004579 TaxID=3154667 RepID=UPI0033BCEEF4